MDREEPSRRAAEVAATRFGELMRARVSLTSDRAIADALAIEARPVAEALLIGATSAARIDAREPELREAIALVSLLGRRAAVLGATPTAAVLIVPTLLEAIDDARISPLIDSLRAVSIEGYAAEREEQAAAVASRRAGDAIAIVELAPGVAGFFPCGVQDGDELERVVDELGRRLLDRGARACVVHLGGLCDPDRERAGRVFAVQATCAMLGVACVFSGVSEGWKRAAREASVDLKEISIEADLAAALRSALARAGLELRAKTGLGDALKRLIKR